MTMIVDSIKKLRARLPFADSVDNPVIYISGSGRSGTTWVAEMISEIRQDRLMFEPFRPGVVPSLKMLNNRQFLEPESSDIGILEGVTHILDGTLRNSWVDRYNHKFKYKGRVVKEIRTNLLIGWMLNSFTDIRVLHIIRDPLSTIKSQLNGGWVLELDKFAEQQPLLEHLPVEYLKLFSEADTVFKKAVLHWAVENYIPVIQRRSNKWDASRYEIFSYEEIKNNPSELIRLLAFCDIAESQTPASLVSKPSRVSRGKVVFDVKDNESGFSYDEMKYTEDVVRIFDLSEWYSFSNS